MKKIFLNTAFLTATLFDCFCMNVNYKNFCINDYRSSRVSDIFSQDQSMQNFEEELRYSFQIIENYTDLDFQRFEDKLLMMFDEKNDFEIYLGGFVNLFRILEKTFDDCRLKYLVNTFLLKDVSFDAFETPLQFFLERDIDPFDLIVRMSYQLGAIDDAFTTIELTLQSLQNAFIKNSWTKESFSKASCFLPKVICEFKDITEIKDGILNHNLFGISERFWANNYQFFELAIKLLTHQDGVNFIHVISDFFKNEILQLFFQEENSHEFKEYLNSIPDVVINLLEYNNDFTKTFSLVNYFIEDIKPSKKSWNTSIRDLFGDNLEYFEDMKQNIYEIYKSKDTQCCTVDFVEKYEGLIVDLVNIFNNIKNKNDFPCEIFKIFGLILVIFEKNNCLDYFVQLILDIWFRHRSEDTPFKVKASVAKMIGYKLLYTERNRSFFIELVQNNPSLAANYLFKIINKKK